MTTDNFLPDNTSRLLDFDRYFDLSLATTKELKAQVYHLRYRVYCEEFGYEPTASFSNEEEVDEFDDNSIHCLVTHRESGMPAGCIRLVLVEGKGLMPLELHAGSSMNQAFLESFSGRRNTLCEISRLAVDGNFRRRRGEAAARFGTSNEFTFSQREQRTFPLITLFLFLAAGAVADILNRKNCFAIMEPFLLVMLRRAGTVFHRVGDDFEFRGNRAPYYANIDELICDSSDDLRQLFVAVRQQFAGALQPVVQEARSDLVSGVLAKLKDGYSCNTRWTSFFLANGYAY